MLACSLLHSFDTASGSLSPLSPALTVCDKVLLPALVVQVTDLLQGGDEREVASEMEQLLIRFTVKVCSLVWPDLQAVLGVHHKVASV